MRAIACLLTGFILALGVQVDSTWAGGGHFGFHSGHHGFIKHKSRTGRFLNSRIQKRMHSIMRQNRQDFLSRLDRRTPSQSTHNRFAPRTKKPEKTFTRPGVGKPIHKFGLKHKGHSRFGGHKFSRRGTFVPGVGFQPFVPIFVPAQPFGTVPGFGVFNQGFFPFSRGVTQSSELSDFERRIMEKTLGSQFRNTQPKWHGSSHAFSSVEGDTESGGKRDSGQPRRSHRELKRMKDGKLVFSDYGGRIVRDKQIGPENRR